MKKKSFFTGKEVEIGEGADNIIMAIESSCDETACAIVKNGREVLANVVASQIKTHAKYGGVIPEIAAREHLDTINPVIQEAVESSGLKPEQIDAFAGTVGYQSQPLPRRSPPLNKKLHNHQYKYCSLKCQRSYERK